MSTRLRRSATSAILLLSVLPLGAKTAPTAPRYTVVDLGAGPGSSPTCVSAEGHVSGRYFAAGERRAFLWQDGVFTDIDALGGVAQASAVDSFGVVVGYAVDGEGVQRAVRVEDGILTDLGMLQGGEAANANDLNDLGWIVGMSQRRFGNDVWQRAALWRDGEIVDLGTFGGEYAEANAVNAAGQVVGWAWYPLPDRRQRAFLWSEGDGLLDLGSLGGGTSTALDLNDHGAVVGSSSTADPDQPYHPFLWTAAGGMVDLGAPPDSFQAAATAINDSGQIVGFAVIIDEDLRIEPLLWSRGARYLLNGRLEPGSGWTVVEAEDINDRGEIAASARSLAGSYRAVLLVPVR
jgi:probable HAF family extracellular repeat protein